MATVNQHPGYAMNVLIIEDDLLSAEMVKRVLEKHNIHADICHSGEESLAKVSSAYDLILLDIELEGIDGFTVADSIRHMDNEIASIPIIALSGHSEPKTVKHAKEVGINGFLVKPLSEHKCSMLLQDYKCHHH